MAYQNVHTEAQNSYLILDFTCSFPTSCYGRFSNMAAIEFDQNWSFFQTGSIWACNTWLYSVLTVENNYIIIACNLQSDYSLSMLIKSNMAAKCMLMN